MGSIVWNGVSSRVIPLIVENPPHYVSAERDYDVQHVPGRNGDLLVASDTFKNVERSYDVAFGSLEKPASELAAATSEWLRSANGYARLEDSYEPDYYRMAYYQQESDFEDILGHLGRGTITFNCMPQRFLKSGETKIVFDLSSVGEETTFYLRNPTNFASRPDIYIYGAGSISIYCNQRANPLQIVGLPSKCKLDGERRGIYGGESFTIWAGEYLSTQGYEYPELILPSGRTFIGVRINSGSFTKMEVVPKWYTL